MGSTLLVLTIILIFIFPEILALIGVFIYAIIASFFEEIINIINAIKRKPPKKE